MMLTMSKYDKYLKGGSLNPAWVDEQERQQIVDDIMDGLEELIECFGAKINMNLAEGIDLSLTNITDSSMPSINSVNELEAKFNFIKNHSDNPEDLKLAREIIGLY